MLSACFRHIIYSVVWFRSNRPASSKAAAEQTAWEVYLDINHLFSHDLKRPFFKNKCTYKISVFKVLFCILYLILKWLSQSILLDSKHWNPFILFILTNKKKWMTQLVCFKSRSKSHFLERKRNWGIEFHDKFLLQWALQHKNKLETRSCNC